MECGGQDVVINHAERTGHVRNLKRLQADYREAVVGRHWTEAVRISIAIDTEWAALHGRLPEDTPNKEVTK